MTPRGLKPSLAYRLFRWLVFKTGDIRFISKARHKITYNEVDLDAMPLLEPGDILLHRDSYYLSNRFIGGVMIHAGIYVGGRQIVEAISEGVVRRNAMALLRSDYACILRPKLDKSEKPQVIQKAIHRARQIVGFQYDPLFEFNSEHELKVITEKGRDYAKNNGIRFCCTEIPHFCYLEKLEDLGVYRRRNINFLTKFISLFGLRPGEAVVDADNYFVGNFDVIWVSRTLSPEKAKKKGAEENFLRKLKRYWQNNPGPSRSELIQGTAKIDL